MIEQRIVAALHAAGDLLTIDDLRALAIARRVQWWGDDRVAIATEVLSYPRRKILNCFMAAGELGAIFELQDDVVAFARAQACSHMIAHGRPAWGRVGAAFGWAPRSIQYIREVPT